MSCLISEQEQVVLGAAGNHVETALDEYFGHGLGVFHYLLLVSLELGLQGFLEAHRLGRDHVLSGPPWRREDCGVELLLDLLVLLGGDQAAARRAGSCG